MGRIRHGSTTTTHAVQAAIQRSQTSLAALSEAFGVRHRYTAISFTHEFSSVIAGGVSPIVGQFLIAIFARLNIGGVASGKLA